MRLRSRFVMLAATSALAIAVCDAASAADFSRRGPAVVPYAPAPAPLPLNYGWSGPYIGAALGYGWGQFDVINQGTIADNGIVGGIFAGYNFQADPTWVWGLEGDVMASGMKGSDSGTSVETRWTSTLRGRLGYLFTPTMMLYGTGGLAVMEGRASSGTPFSATHLGWTAGIGLEAMLAPAMTARIEYRYSDYGTKSYGGTDVRPTSSEILIGSALKF